MPCIVTITGLGTVFLSGNWIVSFIKKLYRFALKDRRRFFQNEDDKRLFLDAELVCESQCEMSPGSGVDLVRFAYQELDPTKFLRSS